MDSTQVQSGEVAASAGFDRVGFARVPEVMRFSGFGRSKVWAMAKCGKFPKPKKLPGTNITVWDRRALWQWYENPEKWAQEHAEPMAA